MTTFEDSASPCPCPPAIIEALGLAVRYAEASFDRSRADVVLGAQYVKTFMEQPSEVWCRYITGDDEVAK